ncbi:uncharacterized protein FFB14_06288 [Fusarium fujikuroi]|nr:uncharacterized protein FFB14_06288 [Fusarium fujikuroi]
MAKRLVLAAPSGRLHQVLATSLNHLDWKRIKKNLFITSFPHVLGMDIVGHVVDPGESRRFQEGDLIVSIGTVGYSDGCSYQTHALVQEDSCCKGANGGVGKLTVQLAKISGYSVVAVTSSNETKAQAQARGADYSFARSDPDLITKIKSVAPDLSLAFDTVVTEETISQIVDCCQKPATVATAIKYTGAAIDGVQLNSVYSGEIMGKTMAGQPSAAGVELGRWLWGGLDNRLGSGQITPLEFEVLNGLQKVQEGLDRLESGTVHKKLVTHVT